MIKLFQQHEKNDDFFEMQKEHLRYSDLSTVLSKSPAHWAYPDPEKKVTEHQEVAIASHMAILDEASFNDKYVRMPAPEDYPNALMNDTQMKAFLKDRGVKGYSTKKTPQLIEMVKMTGEAVTIFPEVEAEFLKTVGKREPLKAKHFDKIVTMRRAIHADAEYSTMLTGGANRLTFIGNLDVDGEEFQVSVTIDSISANADLIDYVSTTNAKDDEFARNCLNYFRLMKAALEYDVVTQYYASIGQDVSFSSVLLCQEKTYPYVAQAYELTQEQLDFGRGQYVSALRYIADCKKQHAYPAYGGGIKTLEFPAWSGVE